MVNNFHSSFIIYEITRVAVRDTPLKIIQSKFNHCEIVKSAGGSRKLQLG